MSIEKAGKKYSTVKVNLADRLRKDFQTRYLKNWQINCVKMKAIAETVKRFFLLK